MNPRRTQPLRRSAKRPTNQALRAAQRGRPAFLPNPQDAKRQLMRKKRRKGRGGSREPANPLFKILGVRRKL